MPYFVGITIDTVMPCFNITIDISDDMLASPIDTVVPCFISITVNTCHASLASLASLKVQWCRKHGITANTMLTSSLTWLWLTVVPYFTIHHASYWHHLSSWLILIVTHIPKYHSLFVSQKTHLPMSMQNESDLVNFKAFKTWFRPSTIWESCCILYPWWTSEYEDRIVWNTAKGLSGKYSIFFFYVSLHQGVYENLHDDDVFFLFLTFCSPNNIWDVFICFPDWWYEW